MEKVTAKAGSGSGFCVVIDKDRCKSCNLCIVYCPVKHLQLSSQLNKRGVRFAQTVLATGCIGCGICFFMCPETCIEVYEKEKK